MRTFHRTDDSRTRFWSIALDDLTLTITYGKLGSAGRTQVVQCPSAAEAARDHRKRIQQKLREGYVEQVSNDPLYAVFENAIVANPADVAAHVAYADWLSEQGEESLRTRGEFIQVQFALEQPGLTAAQQQRLRQREQALLAEHREEWLGSLAGVLFTDAEPRTMVRFARGWIDQVRINQLTVDVARLLARASELRLLRRLDVLGCQSEYEDLDFRVEARSPDVDVDNEYPALSVLRRARHFGNVESFGLGDCDGDAQFCTYPDYAHVAAVLRTMPKLRELRLNVRDLSIAQLLPEAILRELRVLRLERLRLQDDGVQALARRAWPNLRVLQIWNGRFGDDGARALAANESLRQLELLDVSFNWMTEAGVNALAKLGVNVLAEYQMRAADDLDDEYTDDGWGGDDLDDEDEDDEEYDGDWE